LRRAARISVSATRSESTLAHGGGHRHLIHQLFEDVNGDPGVGVALGVGMPERVGGDQGRIERDRPPVRSAQLPSIGPIRATQALNARANAAGGQVAVGSLGAQQRTGEQPAALRGRGGQCKHRPSAPSFANGGTAATDGLFGIFRLPGWVPSRDRVRCLKGGDLVSEAAIWESVTVAGRAERARLARTFVGAVLGPGHPCGDVAVLLASELFGNSVRHIGSGAPGGTVTVAVTTAGGVVRVEVTDRSGPGVPQLRRADHGADGGRGLGLVAGLAVGWGWWRRGGPTVTWFELRHG
jgi:hypothetical protein